jgi:hypothetical protein
MPQERKSASARLSKLRESSRGNPFLDIRSDWSDPSVWARAAREALSLDAASDETNKSIRKAFEEFKLDWRNPYDWRQLLKYYVQAHVPRGRPPMWTSKELCTLLRRISDIREQYPHLKRRREIYGVLVKRGAPYAGKETDYLKYGHKLALDPKHNEILRMHRDAIVQEAMTVIRWSYEAKGKGGCAPCDRR